MTVITRFAPSPTGFLHIGGARTALFNWLFARHHGGKYLLRIEDTDRQRSTPEAVEAIFKSLEWLGLMGDENPIFQYARAPRHQEVAHALVESGHAYRCYCSPEELEVMKEKARLEGQPPRYPGVCRHRTDRPDLPFVVRLKAPQEGETTLHDLVQGTVTLKNTQLDDMILLRTDGTPTYMLSVVVDDHDMNITHVIRGDDHLTNAFRQLQIYKAMDWAIPAFAHIPLIHGADGAKLSKRHGALGTEAYQAMGYLPDAMRNYLLRLGWGHGDEEIIPTEKAIEWFSPEAIGRSPSRFDMAKLNSLNAHYMRHRSDEDLLEELLAFLPSISAVQKERLLKGMNGLKQRAQTLIELQENAQIYLEHLAPDEKSKALLTPEALGYLDVFKTHLESLSSWTHDTIETEARACAENQGLKLGALAQPLRAKVTGRTVSPGIFEVLDVLGKEETLKRLS